MKKILAFTVCALILFSVPCNALSEADKVAGCAVKKVNPDYSESFEIILELPTYDLMKTFLTGSFMLDPFILFATDFDSHFGDFSKNETYLELAKRTDLLSAIDRYTVELNDPANDEKITSFERGAFDKMLRQLKADGYIFEGSPKSAKVQQAR